MSPSTADDLEVLLEGLEDGVTQAEGTCIITVYGPSAFAIIAGKCDRDKSRQAIVAGAHFGKGRLVVLAQDTYVHPTEQSQMKLLTNCLNWVAKRGEREENGESGKIRVGVLTADYLDDWMTENKKQFKLKRLHVSADLTERLHKLDVILLADIVALSDPDHIRTVRKFLKTGGGLVTGATPWHHASNCDIKTDFCGNRLLQETGITYSRTGGAVPIEEGATRFSTDTENLSDTNALEAWEQLMDYLTKNEQLTRKRLHQLLGVITTSVDSLPMEGSLDFPVKIRKDLEKTKHGAKVVIPSEENVITNGVDKLVNKIQVNFTYNVEPAQLHPAAKIFPGVPGEGADRVQNKKLTVKITPGWHSTGLYAPPGEEIEVKFSRPLSTAASIRIGAHNDDISEHEEGFKRCPVISVEKFLPKGENDLRLSNAFGGLIYLCQNDDLPEGQEPEDVEISVSGGITAINFVLGETTLEEWREIRERVGAPWGEVGSDKLILTLPTSKLSKLEDPVELMTFWDRILDAQADLAGIPRQRPKAERIVADVQLSAGYMHAGYPIMMTIDEGSIDTLLSVSLLKSPQSWGQYHELGHNIQDSAWTFDQVGEVTNNVFVLYAYETVCGMTAVEANPEKFMPDAIKEIIKGYEEKGPNFELWVDDDQSGAFIGLLFYYQLQQKYGWSAYKKVFKAYKDLDKAALESDQDKVDMWLVQFSKAVGENLAPLFKDWGLPVRDSAVEQVDQLPKTEQTLFSLIGEKD